MFIYAARDTVTGKLVSNLTNPRRKYWDREGNCRNTVNYHNRRIEVLGLPSNKVEVVKYKLVEVKDDGSI